MAARYTTTNFPEQIKESQKKIRDNFKKSHDALHARENILLSSVDKIGNEYNRKTREIQDLLESLNEATFHCAEALSANKLTDVNEIIRSAIDTKIQELTADIYTSIEFQWDNLFETFIKQLGCLKVNSQAYEPPKETKPPPKETKPPPKKTKPPPKKTKPPPNPPTSTFPSHVKPVVPNYKAKHTPTTYCCTKSSDNKSSTKLNNPGSIAIHYKTGNIYIVDTDNHRVQVLGSNTSSLFMFCEKMNEPMGICLSQNNVFVTQHESHCINRYELRGKLIQSVGSEGNGAAQFKHPRGLDVSDKNNNIYVCDYNNHRVQILTGKLNYHSVLTKDGMNYPHDVKVTREKVLVLTGSNPCLFVFNSHHVLTNSLITRGDGRQTSSPYCFDIDQDYNIIMSDYSNHCVYVFNQKGQKIHKFGKKGQDIGDLYCPYGIALDNTGRVIVACEKEANCLQFF